MSGAISSGPVRFFVMNRITFSGVADAGGYARQAFERRCTDPSVTRLQRIVPLLRKTRITYGDYQPVVEAAGERVFLFLYPPYVSATHSRLYGVRGISTPPLITSALRM